MSGRKQHFIPQSVLRAWGRKRRGNKIQVVAYTRERGIFVAATDGLGAERDFYSELSLEPDEETLDDKITAYETPLADVLSEFRELPNGEAADTDKAAELVTHLVVRNDHFRKAMSSASAMIFSRFGLRLADEKVAKTALGFGGTSRSSKFDEAFGEIWDEHGTVLESFGFARETLSQSAFGMVRDNFSSIYSEFREPVLSALTGIVAKVPEQAAEAQKRSLEQSLAPRIRVEVLRGFRWRTISSARPLVLPDCVAVGVDGAGDALPLIFADKDTLSLVVMPLNPSLLLVGSREECFQLARPNECFAACSWDFFVAQDKDDEFEDLRARLRCRIEPYLNDTIERAVAEAIAS